MKKFKLRPTGRRHVVPLWNQIPIHMIEDDAMACIPDHAIKTKNMIEYELLVYIPETQNPVVFVPEPEYGEKFACAADCEVPDNLFVCKCKCEGKDEFCDNCHGVGYTVEDRNEILNNYFNPDPDLVKLLPRK